MGAKLLVGGIWASTSGTQNVKKPQLTKACPRLRV